MKVQTVIATLAALLLSVDGASKTARLQCAGGVPDTTRGDGSGIIYESTGFLTADFTQKACAAARGSIDPNKKGNQKCCEVPADAVARINDFDVSCESLKAGSKYPSFLSFSRGCN